MTRYKLKLYWIDGAEGETVSFLNRRAAERRAKSWREVALISRVEVIKARDDLSTDAKFAALRAALG